MKVRIITGVTSTLCVIMILVGTGLAIPGVMSVTMSVIGAIAAYEIMQVSKCKNKLLTAISMIVAAIIPIYVDFDLHSFIPVPLSVMITAYVVFMLAVMLKFYETTKFEHLMYALFASMVIPGALSTFFSVRDLCETHPDLFQRSHCVFLVLIAMYGAWMSDTFAYFIGSKFGKHKLAPEISPKKSVEGAIAGVIGNVIVSVITFFVCDHFFFVIDTVNVWMVMVASAVLSVLGMLGDLSASVIKRNFGAKDFGNLFPGHGGALDRIDSFLVTMPAIYAMVQLALEFTN